MIYAQEKSGQKLHLVYELHNGNLTNPVCGKKVNNYRMTINVPLGNSCGNCRRVLNSLAHDSNEFIRPYYN